MVGLLMGLLILSGCVQGIPVPDAAASDETTAATDARLQDISSGDLDNPEPVLIPEVTAIVNTEGSRANVRSGPELNAPIVAKANPGDEFQVIGMSADGEWLQICCIRGPLDGDDEATETAWLAAVVVDVDGNTEVIPVVDSLLPDDIAATWHVDWSCGSERCEVPECAATVSAASDGAGSDQWLRVSYDVEWEDSCFEPDNWTFEVDRFSGRERSGEFVDNFLYNYWMGEQPGPATNIFSMDNGSRVAVWCSGPHEFEIEEGEGWTTLYQGNTCHDVRTGELMMLNYTKRWLYTGEFEGQAYERAYFGDFETLDQYLVDTNAELFYIE
ncbi:MAG: SH3 domain-containing protein [Litorilinea sp.]